MTRVQKLAALLIILGPVYLFPIASIFGIAIAIVVVVVLALSRPDVQLHQNAAVAHSESENAPMASNGERASTASTREP